MKEKKYNKGCEWCGGTGYVSISYNPSMSSTSPLTNVCPVCNGSGKIEVIEAEYNFWPELKKFFIQEGFVVKHHFEDGYHNVIFYYKDQEVIQCMSEDIGDAYEDATRVCLNYYGEKISKKRARK